MPSPEPRAPSPAYSFQDLVDAELRVARSMYPPRQRHLESAAHIRARFEDYWAQVRQRADGGDPRPLLHCLVQVAAMAQRGAEDLGLVADRPFAALVSADVPQLRECLHVPLTTSHAAATWLRLGVHRYEDAIAQGLFRNAPNLALHVLVDVAARCRIVADDLHLIDQVEQRVSAAAPPPPPSIAPAEPRCPSCGSLDLKTDPKLPGWFRCNTCGLGRRGGAHAGSAAQLTEPT